jgi:hypothetical protein
MGGFPGASPWVVVDGKVLGMIFGSIALVFWDWWSGIKIKNIECYDP